MVTKIYYNDARIALSEFFLLEFSTLKDSEIEKYINFFYKLSNYEEEGLKVRPDIFVTNNISVVVKTIPNVQKICMYEDSDAINFKQRIKALMCFCVKEWSIYINYSDDSVEYGLIKAINSIKDKSLSKLILENPAKEKIASKCSLVNINVVSGGLILLEGVKNNKTSVCFNLEQQSDVEWESTIRQFVDSCVIKLKTTQRKLNDIKNLYVNIFTRAFKGLHGTICLVVDKDFTDTKGFLADGTWLKTPIEFGKLFLQSKSFSESKLISYADLLITMLNYDGITIIDNAGRIRAYNVFIESSQTVAKNVLGGARRRAAYTLLNNKNKKIVGVYFQSQDGDNFYKEGSFKTNKTNTKKSKEKITEICQLDINDVTK